jgi:hypothetical protein
MPVPFGRQDCIESFRGPGDEVDALVLEQRAVVLLRECQRCGRRVDVDASRELAFADQLQPVEPVPDALFRSSDFIRIMKYSEFWG